MGRRTEFEWAQVDTGIVAKRLSDLYTAQVQFGKYLIAQNVLKTRTFWLNASGVKRARGLATNKIYTHFPIAIKPRTAAAFEILE